MGTRHLTQKQKADWLDIIIMRDGKFACFYCNRDFFSLSDYVYDHLNNKRTDNRVDNVVLCCVTCNNKKPHSIEMQIIATEKLRGNEISNYMRENTNVRANRRQSSEIQINELNFEIAKVWIIKFVDLHRFVLFNEALNSISYVCKEKTGHGSQQSVRNYINSLTSLAGPFELIKKDGKKIIRRKQNHN